MMKFNVEKCVINLIKQSRIEKHANDYEKKNLANKNEI